MMITFESRLMAVNGKPTGFDYMRIFLATVVVIWHEAIICYGGKAEHSILFEMVWPRGFIDLVLPMFFALSGFLVAGSLERSRTLLTFMGLRAIRLIPALAVESILAILVLGLTFTTVSKSDYFASHETRAYLLNIIGKIHYYLPGVFRSNPDSRVNAQLAVLPFELKCYIAIFLIALLSGYRRGWLLLLATAMYFVFDMYRFYRHVDLYVGFVRGPELVNCFLFGIVLFRYRTRIIWSWRVALLSAILSYGLLCFTITQVFAAPFAAYLTVWLGLLQPRLVWPLTNGDYSYPTYLYGFPVQQAVFASLPFGRTWWGNLLVALPIVYAIATLSWHFIEKPSQRPGRKLLSRVEGIWLPIRSAAFKHALGLCPRGLRSRWFPAPQEAGS